MKQTKSGLPWLGGGENPRTKTNEPFSIPNPYLMCPEGTSEEDGMKIMGLEQHYHSFQIRNPMVL